MYVCWSSFHLSSTLSICLIFSYSLKLLKIADATVVSECQSKCNVHLLLFFFLFAQLWALKRTLCAYCIQLPIALANIFCNFLLFFFLFAQLEALKRTLCSYTHNCNWTIIVFFFTISPSYSICSSQPSMVHWLSSSIFPCWLVVRSSRYGNIRPNLHFFQYIPA